LTAAGAERQLRTRAWHGDEPLELVFPASWHVETRWPATPYPLSDEQLAEGLERPLGQPPIRELARGARRPVVIVDDPTRPTPVARVLPAVLRQLADAGIAAERVSILVATGAHDAPAMKALSEKLGPDAMTKCRVLVHDDARGNEKVGRTRCGTPVFVDREVLAGDFLIGIGGVLPQQTIRFGGGSKLALGVLGRRTIMGLHYGHSHVGSPYALQDGFRRELDEIASMIGLRTMISLLVDGSRRPFRIFAGDHFAYYAEAAGLARKSLLVQPPGEADVVVANAYPVDTSLTFAHKSMSPLSHAALAASRILVSACSEGVGYHRLFPMLGESSYQRGKRWARVAYHMPRVLPGRAWRRASQRLQAPRRWISREREVGASRPLWLYPAGAPTGSLPREIPGMTACYSWAELLRRVAAEQGGRASLRAVVYPCAPLQVLDLSRVGESDVARALHGE
jgi:nickel-dependent lactate racemase